jgi:hypothetical protein
MQEAWNYAMTNMEGPMSTPGRQNGARRSVTMTERALRKEYVREPGANDSGSIGNVIARMRRMNIGRRSRKAKGAIFLGAAFASIVGTRAAAGSTLSSADFTVTLSRVDSSGNTTTLDDASLKTYFSAARCACPTNVVATLTLASASASKVGSSSVQAQLSVGSDCDNSAATGCQSLGSTLTLTETTTSTTETISTASFFEGTTCAADSTATRLWAIVRQDGSRLDSEPSLAINLGGAGLVSPTATAAQSADKGLLVSWRTSADSSTIQGHQVLCSPALASPPSAAFDYCSASAPTGGTGPFATLDSKYVCSDLVTVGTNSVRIHSLVNGQSYQVAVVAVGNDGTASSPSTIATGTPAPTYGFDDIYYQNGGTAQTGCAIAGEEQDTDSGLGRIVCLLFVCTSLLRCRRRFTWRAARGRARVATLAVLVAIGGSGTARAATFAEMQLGTTEDTVPKGEPSPRGWNLELRFGPYRPGVDDEFSARGSDARPYAQTFSTSRHLMSQIEIDRQLSHLAGTWALGVTAGYMRVSAASFSADLATRSGDQTALRVVPTSLSLVYRADQLRRYEQIGLIPYAKVGLDCAFWSISNTAKASDTTGRTLGWHTSAGLSLDLASLDPDAARTMDAETGVNQTALFVEVGRYALNGFGASNVLHVGDTTWLAGLMLEF